MHIISAFLLRRNLVVFAGKEDDHVSDVNAKTHPEDA